ncbi:MAG: radical SAM protein [Rudaea sp.]
MSMGREAHLPLREGQAVTTLYAWCDHRLFDAGDGALLFGADDASLFAIDSPTRETIARWRDREAIDLDKAPEQDREALAALRDLRVLRPLDRPRVRAPAPDPAAIPLGTLVLEAAQACNLRCTYCYAQGGSYGGKARIMEPKLAARAAHRLVEASGDRRTVTLVLFGGEPLLNVPALEAAVGEAEAAAAALGKVLVVSITTNGTRFTDESLDFLARHRVGVSVSIDGPPDVHDANRRYADARGGTYADVVDGVRKFRARTGRAPAARVTLEPGQWHRVPEVFDHLMSLGFLEVGIAPASPSDARLLPNREQERSLIEGFSRLARRFVDEATRGRVLPLSNLLDVLARLHAGEAKSAPCGAGLGYLALDAQGRFYLCHRLAGVARFEVGSLDAGIDHERIRACLDEEAAPRRDACAACWARSLCAGGCHYENHVRERELGLAQGGTCDFIRRWLEIGIRVYAGLCEQPDDAVMAFLERRAQS